MSCEPILPLAFKRATVRQSTLRAGCYVCHGPASRWTSANAQALAAQHHDRTGHATWCTIATEICYGRIAPDPRQIDIEDAIASASSGDRPDDAAPLPDPDTPAGATAGASAPPKAALSKRALAAAKPEPIHV